MPASIHMLSISGAAKEAVPVLLTCCISRIGLDVTLRVKLAQAQRHFRAVDFCVDVRQQRIKGGGLLMARLLLRCIFAISFVVEEHKRTRVAALWVNVCYCCRA
jgi:hypothetical protein